MPPAQFQLATVLQMSAIFFSIHGTIFNAQLPMMIPIHLESTFLPSTVTHGVETLHTPPPVMMFLFRISAIPAFQFSSPNTVAMSQIPVSSQKFQSCMVH